jgi:hypothetical protein
MMSVIQKYDLSQASSNTSRITKKGHVKWRRRYIMDEIHSKPAFVVRMART